jgi:hypothetical protein
MQASPAQSEAKADSSALIFLGLARLDASRVLPGVLQRRSLHLIACYARFGVGRYDGALGVGWGELLALAHFCSSDTAASSPMRSLETHYS